MTLETILPLLGILMCALVLAQLGLWTANSFRELVGGRKQFQLSQELLRKQIEAAAHQSKSEVEETKPGHWQGFRQFRVHQLVKETELCTSVYLQPTDGKPICSFQPGQHLTLKFPVPGQQKPVVRCYSLSCGPDQDGYRISVKAVPAPRDRNDLPPGLVSNFVNRGLMQGDLVDVKAPSGHFFLDPDSESPVVLLAGGIGITPLLSMVDYVITNQPKRQIILFYGSRNGADHAFKSYLSQVQEQFKNVFVVNVYSMPNPGDKQGVDYHVEGFISTELIQQVLPNQAFQFYMCGPPPFMDAVFNGLTEWGVPESRIHFEAFGPASIGKSRKKNTPDSRPAQKATDSGTAIEFTESGVTVNWTESSESILEAAESNGVELESGCRAGSCGTCQIAIKKGKVKYPDGQQVDCDPGHCLACIAQPDGPLELEG